MAEKESDSSHGEAELLQMFISLIHSQLYEVILIDNYVKYYWPLNCFLGSTKRYRMKAIQTSKHCNIICMYTAFTTTDGNANKAFPDSMGVQNTGVPCYSLTHLSTILAITIITSELSSLKKYLQRYLDNDRNV